MEVHTHAPLLLTTHAPVLLTVGDKAFGKGGAAGADGDGAGLAQMRNPALTSVLSEDQTTG